MLYIMAGSIRRFFSNIVCGFIANKDTRKRVRVILNSDMLSALRFIRRNTGLKLTKIKTFVGYQARNLLISVNDEYVFKFPLRRSNSRELTLRERRVVDVFARISPIYVPSVMVFEHRGELVRRYEFIRGTQLRQVPLDIAMANIDKLASQIAQFLFTVGMSDPDELRDLKPSPDAVPGYMYGWFQGDICDNFFIDTTTMEIVAFIDWEDCIFGDFSDCVYGHKCSPQRELMAAVGREYDKLWSMYHDA